ncbi:hypothetical protein, partial [Pandoraea apista]
MTIVFSLRLFGLLRSPRLASDHGEKQKAPQTPSPRGFILREPRGFLRTEYRRPCRRSRRPIAWPALA